MPGMIDLNLENIHATLLFQLISGMKTHDSVDFPTGFSPSLLVPNTRDFFTYEGSLTTPPCSEIVQWLVLREPLKINENDVRCD